MSLNLSRVAYTVETERLRLRCWSPEDAPALRAALDKSDEHLRPWIPFMKDEPRSLSDTVDWLRGHRAAFDRNENFRFAVFLSGGGDLVGENMLLTRQGPDALEIGYLTHAGFERKGYALEGSAALIRVAFELYEVRRVEVHHAATNAASGAIPKRLGFKREATRCDFFEDTEGRRHDCVIWCLHRQDYAQSPTSNLPLKAYDALGEELISSARS